MTLDLYYANFNESNIENQLEKIYRPYLLDNSNEANTTIVTISSNRASTPLMSAQPRRVEEKRVTQSNGRMKIPPPPMTSHSNGRPAYIEKRSVPPKSPLKNQSRPAPGRSSEPAQRSVTPSSNHHNQQKTTSPQKKFSPKELRTRQNTKTPPKQERSSSNAPKSPLCKVESAIDKLQIKSPSDAKQSSNQQPPQQQQITPPTSPTKLQASSHDENVLKQQNSNGNSMGKTRGSGAVGASAGINSKVYFKEENVENLSWNGETSFEFDDPELLTGDASPKPNQYSSSFLNFLSNN
jgi:hypothetical protein